MPRKKMSLTTTGLVQEGLNGMNLLCQQGASRLVVIHLLGILIIRNANIHDIDAVYGRRVHRDKLTADSLTAAAAVVLQAFQGGEIMNTCVSISDRRSAKSCAVKVLPYPVDPRITAFAFA